MLLTSLSTLFLIKLNDIEKRMNSKDDIFFQLLKENGFTVKEVYIIFIFLIIFYKLDLFIYRLMLMNHGIQFTNQITD